MADVKISVTGALLPHGQRGCCLGSSEAFVVKTIMIMIMMIMLKYYFNSFVTSGLFLGNVMVICKLTNSEIQRDNE